MAKVRVSPKKQYHLSMSLTVDGVEKTGTATIVGTSFGAAMDDFEAMDVIEGQLGYSSADPPEGLTKLTFTIERVTGYPVSPSGLPTTEVHGTEVTRDSL